LKRDIYGISELMSDFPQEEYAMRCERARALMEQENIDGVLIGKEENVTYFSGFRRPISYQFVYMLLPKDNPPVLVTSVDQKGNSEMTWVEDIRFYGPSSLGLEDAKETSRKLLNEFDLTNQTIGVELSPQVTRQDVWDTLTGQIDDIKYVDSLIWKLRMIKSPREINNIRKACNITCKAFQMGLGAIQEGMTENEFARIVYRTMIDEGGEDTPLRGALNLRGGSKRYAMFDTRPTDYKLQKGDIIILDGGITYKGYWSDITRLTCIGKPSERQKKMFEACLEAEIAGFEALQPGMKISEVCNTVERVLEKYGMNNNKFPGEPLGHGVGLEIHEPPSIAPNSDVVLEPGMVLAIEPCLYDDPVMKSIFERYTPGGEGVFFVEDNVLITEKGPENLSPIPKDLNIV